MGVILVIVEPQSQLRAKVTKVHGFSLKLLKMLENKGPQLGIFNPHPSDC